MHSPRTITQAQPRVLWWCYLWSFWSKLSWKLSHAYTYTHTSIVFVTSCEHISISLECITVFFNWRGESLSKYAQALYRVGGLWRELIAAFLLADDRRLFCIFFFPSYFAPQRDDLLVRLFIFFISMRGVRSIVELSSSIFVKYINFFYFIEKNIYIYIFWLLFDSTDVFDIFEWIFYSKKAYGKKKKIFYPPLLERVLYIPAIFFFILSSRIWVLGYVHSAFKWSSDAFRSYNNIERPFLGNRFKRSARNNHFNYSRIASNDVYESSTA